MEILNLKEKNKNQDKDKNEEQSKSGDSTQFRVVITKEANGELEKYLKKAGEGKEPIDLTKSDLANYVFCNLSKFLTEADLKTLRSLHFDERRVLQSLLKQSNEDGELPPELKRVIREFYGIGEKEKRRAIKATSGEYPNEKTTAA